MAKKTTGRKSNCKKREKNRALAGNCLAGGQSSHARSCLPLFPPSSYGIRINSSICASCTQERGRRIFVCQCINSFGYVLRLWGRTCAGHLGVTTSGLPLTTLLFPFPFVCSIITLAPRWIHREQHALVHNLKKTGWKAPGFSLKAAKIYFFTA